VILLDASGLFAFLNDRQPKHADVRRVLEIEPGPLVLSPFVLAEVDYLVQARAGVDAELALLADVAAGAYALEALSADDVAEAADLIRQYRDLRIGLADASIVVLAGRYRTNRVLTLDDRHFRAMRTPRGEPFLVLPADA
jgi:predicted nucleic acid-binding protein